jgi:hypothetical protein
MDKTTACLSASGLPHPITPVSKTVSKVLFHTLTTHVAVSNVNDANIACKSGFQSPVSSKVINVKAGDKVGVNWGHIIGGAQSSNDADNPIANSHKGPVLFYMYADISLLHAD